MVAKRRLGICKSNVCGLYDPTGAGAICISGKGGCCLGCGCGGTYKTHSLSSWCTLKDQGKPPLWEAEMGEKEEAEFRNKSGIKNE